MNRRNAVNVVTKTPVDAVDVPAPPQGAGMKWLAVGVAAALGALAVYLAQSYTREPPPDALVTPGISVEHDRIILAQHAPQWRMLKVAAAQAAVARFTEPLPARIKIDERRANRVGVPLDGRISRVDVELGESVKTGQALFSVSSPTLAELGAERDKTALDMDVARTALERVKEMVAARALPAKEELAAAQQFKQAELAHQLVISKMEALRVSSATPNEYTVKAPREGVVVVKNVLYGQEVSKGSGDVLMVVADLSDVWVVAELLEADAVHVKHGTESEITSPSLPGFSVRGKVEMVSAVVDPDRHTIPIRVRLDNKGGELRPNMYARVRFLAQPVPGSVDVAANAVVTDGAHQFVYVQDGDDRFVRREVVAGTVSDGRVPVLKGISVGEKVVEDGALLLDNQLQLTQ
jgi:RND family efflux transporter MFP subunit